MRLNKNNKNLIIFFIIVLTAGVSFAQFRETKLLTNNNVIALAGSGDTLWLATERGFNYQTRIDTAGVWLGFEYNELGVWVGGLEFGGGAAAAILHNNNNGKAAFWQFDHKTGKQKESEYFSFSGGEAGENNDYFATGSMVYAHGNFWAAFGCGGLVKYNPVTNAVLAIRPGDAAEVSPDKLSPLSGGDSVKAVREIGVIKNTGGGDSLILVATPDTSMVWTYNPANRAWSSIDKNEKPIDPIYKAIDSTNDSSGFRKYLEKIGDNPNPEINCIIFLPSKVNADSGTLAIGTTTGLYICRSAKPLINSYGQFYLEKYVRPVKTGDNYALPGILRGSADGRYDKCVFVYKLKKDGDVTIKIYDYNMSLVKTVVKGKPRKKGSEGARSTEPLSDFWDGTSVAGKRVWPGVYYYKITSTGGDRLFGKIILAK